MPISLSAKKSLRKSVKNRKANLGVKNKVKLVLKTFLAKPTEKGLNEAFSALDKAKKNGIFHKNKVARLKSQYSKKVAGKAEVKAPVKKTTKAKTKKM